MRHHCMASRRGQESIELLQVETTGERDGAEDLRFHTSDGENRARFHEATGATAAVLWVFGAGGGLGGPAGGIYERLAHSLAPDIAASLQVDYRRPGDMLSCVVDVLVGIEYLKARGYARIILVGHSFGGAVVINGALHSKDVIAVAALSPQTYGVGDVARVSPRPVLFAHGDDDEILPSTCSLTLYTAAREPKTLKLYAGCRHGLDDCREQLDRDLQDWLIAALRPGSPQPA